MEARLGLAGPTEVGTLALPVCLSHLERRLLPGFRRRAVSLGWRGMGRLGDRVGDGIGSTGGQVRVWLGVLPVEGHG